MKWDEIRRHLPHQWLILEALKSHSESDMWIPDEISVIEVVPDAAQVMPRYTALRHEYPGRTFFFMHTDREAMEIKKSIRLPIRPLP